MNDVNFEQLNDFFVKNNFKKRGKVWFLDKGYCLILFEYQKSVFSPRFFMNIGVIFKMVSKSLEGLQSYHWHFRGRHNVEGIISESNINILTHAIINDDLPFLEKITEIDYLKKNFPDNFPHEKLWIANVASAQLREYFQSL
jgi:hypothetical protein